MELGFRPPAREQPIEASPYVPITEQGRAARGLKRGFDIVIALVSLILLAPLLLLITLLIKADSPGPILFRSLRAGRRGEPLRMLKFRTMADGADGNRESLRHLSDATGGLFKIENDPRVTRFGSLLRRTTLDELPQLFHVVTGQMSLVGPRPLPPEEDALLEDDGWRFQARPGITGPWQIAGSWRVGLPEMVKLDNDYLANWSVGRDLKLLALTVRHAIRREGV